MKNAIFGCVLGNQPQTLEHILSFTYSPADILIEFKNAKDSKGNTVMHLAYQLRRVKIAKILDVNEFYDVEIMERNARGQIPGEMSHSLEDILAFEKMAHIENFVLRHKKLKLA